MYGGAFVEVDRGEQKLKIINGVLGRFRGRLVTIRQFSPVDRDPVHRKERQDLEGTPGRLRGGLRLRGGRRSRCFGTEGRDIELALDIFQDRDDRVAQGDLLDVDFALEQRQQLDADIQ